MADLPERPQSKYIAQQYADTALDLFPRAFQLHAGDFLDDVVHFSPARKPMRASAADEFRKVHVTMALVH